MTSRSEPSGWSVGFTAFAAVMMVLIGFFQAMMGLVAILNQDFYVATENYIFAFDVGTWGWIHLVIGIVVVVAGLALFSGATWARVVGIALGALAAIEAFVFIPYQPIWSVVVIALSVGVIWALTTKVPFDVDYDPDATPPETYT